MIKTKQDYIDSLKKLKAVVYYKGKRVEDVTAHPAFVPHINAAAKTYELALVPENEDLMTATSHLTGKKSQPLHPCPPEPRRPHQKGPDAPFDLPRDGQLLPALRRLRRHERPVQHDLRNRRKVRHPLSPAHEEIHPVHTGNQLHGGGFHDRPEGGPFQGARPSRPTRTSSPM